MNGARNQRTKRIASETQQQPQRRRCLRSFHNINLWRENRASSRWQDDKPGDATGTCNGRPRHLPTAHTTHHTHYIALLATPNATVQNKRKQTLGLLRPSLRNFNTLSHVNHLSLRRLRLGHCNGVFFRSNLKPRQSLQE